MNAHPARGGARPAETTKTLSGSLPVQISQAGAYGLDDLAAGLTLAASEGPLLDLAFDYETLAPRIIDGALGELLAGKTPAAVTPAPTLEHSAPPDTETLVKAVADALKLHD